MSLIIRFLIRNIAEKKGRSILIILSVMLSSALFLATTGMSTTMKDIFARRLSQYFGTAQILIHSEKRSPSWLHSPGKLQRSGLPFAYVVPSIETGGRIRRESGEWSDVSARGFELDGLMEMAPPLWLDEAPADFRGNRLILGEHSAEYFNLKVGDTVSVWVNGSPHRFSVAAIAHSTGLFTNDGRNHTIVIPLDKLAVAVAGRGRSSVTYVRAADPAGPEEVAELMEDIQAVYPRYRVRETVLQSDIDQWTRDSTIPFTIMSFLVFFMSIFIIYTCFRVITLERLPVIGTFRSVGATRRATASILISESVLYGILGGLPGLAAGLGVLRLLIFATSNEWMRAVAAKLVVTPLQMVSALVIAIGLSAASAAIPVIRAARLPVKDVVLGAVEDHVRRRPGRYIAGGLLVAAGTILPHFLGEKLMLPLGSMCLFSVIIGMVMALPWIVRHLVSAAALVNRRIFGNIGELASKNLRDDPSVINNIALLTIGITSIFMITTMSLSAARSLTEFYTDARFDVWMWSENSDRRGEARLRRIPGVEDLVGVYEIWNVEIADTDRTVRQIQGISGPEVLEWWDFPIHDRNPAELLDRLDDSRSLMLSAKTKRRLGLEVGETLTLMLGEPPRPREYEIIGTFSSPDDTGGYALMASRWFKMDTGRRKYGDIWIKAPDNPDEVKAEIEEIYKRRSLWISTMDEMAESNAEELKQIFLMLQFFSILAMLIASVGIVNNYLVSYLERRRVLAVIRSVGMSSRQATKMLLVEALTGGILGAVAGLVGGLAISSFLPPYLQAFDLAIKLTISPPWMVMLLVLGALLSLGAQVLPSMKSRQMNLLESLKYE